MMINAAKGIAVCGLLVLGIAFGSHAQDQDAKKQDAKKQDAKKQDAGMASMPAPEVTAEHKWLAEDAGTWKAQMSMWEMPGAEPVKTTATEKVEVLGGGLWVFNEYEQDGGGFHGRGVSGYDANKKKIVGSWVDSMTSELMLSEGTLDLKTNTLVCTMKATNPMTKEPMTMRETAVRKDAKHRTFTMEMDMGGGKWMKMMEIAYEKM